MTDPTARLRALLDGLKREHTAACNEAWEDYPAKHADRPCYCGADEHNARVEELRAAIRDAAIEAATTWTPRSRVLELLNGQTPEYGTERNALDVLCAFGIEVKRG